MRTIIEHLGGSSCWVGRRDPRWKLATLLPAAAAVALLRSLPAVGIALVAGLVLALGGGVPWRWLGSRLGAVALLLVPFVLLLPILPDGGPAWSLGPLHLSANGLGLALLLSGKALALTTLVLTLTATSPLPDTLKAAQSLRLPRLLVHLALMTYRYVFVIAAEMARLRVALRVRGFRNRPNLHSYRTVGHVAGTLLVRSSEQAERVAQAMRCRGFDGRFRSLTEFRTGPADVFLFCLVSAAAVGLATWDLWGSRLV